MSMVSHVRTKQAALVAILFVLAVPVPLLIRAVPWPIPVTAVSYPLSRPWWGVSQSNVIFLAEMERVNGMICRTSELNVLETIKGPDMPSHVSFDLGRIAGTNDQGNVFLVLLSDRDGYVVAAQRVRSPKGPVGVVAPWLDVPGIAHLPASLLVDTVRKIVKVQADPGKNLSKEQVQVLEGWLDPNDFAWYYLRNEDIVDDLKLRKDDPEANRLLGRFMGGKGDY